MSIPSSFFPPITSLLPPPEESIPRTDDLRKIRNFRRRLEIVRHPPSINRCQRAFIGAFHVREIRFLRRLWEGCCCIPATSAFEFSSSRKLSQRERDIPVWPVYEPRYVLANLLPTILLFDIYIYDFLEKIRQHSRGLNEICLQNCVQTKYFSGKFNKRFVFFLLENIEFFFSIPFFFFAAQKHEKIIYNGLIIASF